MSEPIHEPGLTEFEASLAALTPTPAAINRDALLFRAGQASVKRRWVWLMTSGVLAAVAASLAIALMLRPPPDSVPAMRYVEAAAPAEIKAASNAPPNAPSIPDRLGGFLQDQSYVRQYRVTQDQLLRWGLDAVPSPRRVATNEHDLFRTPAADPPSSTQPWYQQFFQLGDSE